MPKAILLDLGGVVLGINAAQVFRTWATRAGVEAEHFERRWVMDEAYELHEIGAIDFAEYARRQGQHFAIDMPLTDWQEGWNAIWTAPYAKVVALLPELAKHYDLFAFSNTNAVHAESFCGRYPEALAHFHRMFLSHEVGVRKPHPAAFMHVCEQINTPPRDVLFIDDSAENIEGALTAGLDAHHLYKEQDIAAKLGSLLD
jgi:HAD superfamily hydrolase (TIGR01509 family)